MRKKPNFFALVFVLALLYVALQIYSSVLLARTIDQTPAVRQDVLQTTGTQQRPTNSSSMAATLATTTHATPPPSTDTVHQVLKPIVSPRISNVADVALVESTVSHRRVAYLLDMDEATLQQHVICNLKHARFEDTLPQQNQVNNKQVEPIDKEEQPSIVEERGRLIFAVHPGQSGSGFLAKLLDTCEEKTRSFHIPAALAMGDDFMIKAGIEKIELSYEQRKSKISRIEMAFRNYLNPDGIYIETNPYFIHTFYDVILNEFGNKKNWNIDIIILRRNFDETLKSLIETGYYTFNANTNREIVSTTSPNALFKPVDSEENMDEYDRLISYMLDIELRSRQLEKAFSRFSNVRFVPFRHELLLSRVGAKNAFSALNLTWTVSSDDFIAEKRLVDAQHKVKRRFAIDTTLDYCRKRMELYLARVGDSDFVRSLAQWTRAVQTPPDALRHAFLDEFTSIENAHQDIYDDVYVVHEIDLKLSEDMRQQLYSRLPPFLASKESIPTNNTLVFCLQWIQQSSQSLLTLQLARLEALCDVVLLFDDNANVKAERLSKNNFKFRTVFVRKIPSRFNVERDFNAIFQIARHFLATHFWISMPFEVLSKDCNVFQLKQQLLQMEKGKSIQLKLFRAYYQNFNKIRFGFVDDPVKRAVLLERSNEMTILSGGSYFRNFPFGNDQQPFSLNDDLHCSVLDLSTFNEKTLHIRLAWLIVQLHLFHKKLLPVALLELNLSERAIESPSTAAFGSRLDKLSLSADFALDQEIVQLSANFEHEITVPETLERRKEALVGFETLIKHQQWFNLTEVQKSYLTDVLLNE